MGAFRATPTGFLPSEDQGAFFVELQLPEGSSVNRTRAVAERVEQILLHTEGISDVSTVVGYSFIDGLAKSNGGFLIVLLKSFEERHDPALGVDSLLAKLRGEFQAVREANVIAFNLPPIIGLGTGSGFEYQLQDLRGGDPAELAAAARGLVFTANQDPALRAVFTTYSANTPQLYLDVDRDKVQTLGISVGDVINVLQAILGGFYINDFNLFGRTWQVNVQAEAADRAKADDIYRIHVRNRQGQMVPLRAFAEPQLTLRLQTIVRYNIYPSVTLNGGPAEGRSSGEALAAMERLSESTLPQGFGYERTGTALQEEAAGQTAVILGLAVLFAYLFLVAL
jgi:multidrug efflux pump subunit AcrB